MLWQHGIMLLEALELVKNGNTHQYQISSHGKTLYLPPKKQGIMFTC